MSNRISLRNSVSSMAIISSGTPHWEMIWVISWQKHSSFNSRADTFTDTRAK